jgi:hypothetical protein
MYIGVFVRNTRYGNVYSHFQMLKFQVGVIAHITNHHPLEFFLGFGNGIELTPRVQARLIIEMEVKFFYHILFIW